MQKREGYIDFRGYKTWYSTYGNFDGETTPLIALHGGPGYPHYHLQNLSLLAERGIPVVLYDQLGCGKSDKPDNPKLWTINLFVDELNTVIKHLNLEKVSLLGHSWGGTLAAEYALTHPDKLEKIILSSPMLNTKLWVEEADRLKDLLPAEVAKTMRRNEQAGTTDSKEYKKAAEIFDKHFVCRLDPKPQDIQQAENKASAQVYETMWGPSEAHATGVLKNVNYLGKISDIHLPVLLLSGKYDEATPKQVQLAKDAIPSSKWVLFENSSHSANYEETEKYLATVENFLISH